MSDFHRHDQFDKLENWFRHTVVEILHALGKKTSCRTGSFPGPRDEFLQLLSNAFVLIVS